MRYGALTAAKEIAERAGDGLQTPIASTSAFPTVAPGPGVWRLTPPAYLPPQTPWVANMRPFVLRSADQFLPPPPPSLSSKEWADAFNEIKAVGSKTNTNTAQTNVAWFETANVIRQYNLGARDLATAKSLDLVQTARLVAMVNTVGADCGIAVMNAKYHYLFWRPVTAIDPNSVTNDGFGPVVGFDDGNPATDEQQGWRPLITTPNHPEYPAAHGTLSSGMAEVFRTFLGTDAINVYVHGFDPTGPPGNLNAVQFFATPADMRTEIINARLWAGLHYRFSSVAGVNLGREVAQYDLAHAFGPSGAAG
jgi:VCPO second helical-bundle domain